MTQRQRSQLQLDLAAGGASFDIGVLRGDGRGSFDELEVRRLVRGLRMSDRMRLYVTPQTRLKLDLCADAVSQNPHHSGL